MTTKRENIITTIVSTIESVSSILSVQRKQPASPSELKNLAQTQLPMVAVVGGVPVPVSHQRGRDKQKDVFVSALRVDLFTYFMDYDDGDKKVSELLNDLWVAMYADQTIGGHALEMSLSPNSDRAFWHPYGAFSLVVNVQYKHGIGGI